MSYRYMASSLLKDALIEVADKRLDDCLISAMTMDSRAVEPGSLFCAIPGLQADGRDFIDHAINNGASVILTEAEGFDLNVYSTETEAQSVPIVAVQGLAERIGELANLFFKQPSSDMQVFGVTGTNGKTTCCYLLAQAFEKLGLKSGVLGTLGYGQINDIKSGALTTPDAISVHRQLAEMRDAGVTQVCMEVSSHALDQGRVLGVQFYSTLFTNLSQDHLDYHGDMHTYGLAKSKLFQSFSAELSVVNVEDEFGQSLIDNLNADFVVSYGLGGDVYADEISATESGIRLYLEGNGVEFEIESKLVGLVNVPNILLVVATLLGLSVSIEEIKHIVLALHPAPGRMESFAFNKGAVVVDYAHTPDALEKALISVREHCSEELWCVFGCGGDRDRGKRRLMGEVADRLADHIIITNDNPRSESPQAIAEDILEGVKGSAKVELDRANAIRTSIMEAAEGDWVLVAGKGHETTQTVGSQVLPFSDRAQVESAIEVQAC